MDSFEKHLRQMKYPSPPDNLRDRCLAGLEIKIDSTKELEQESVLASVWSRWLWPHPKAWAGLACVWFICFGLNHWTLPLAQISTRTSATGPSQQTTLPISVMHYSLAMDSETEAWTPETTTAIPEPEEDGIKPSASRKLKHYKKNHSHASYIKNEEKAKIYS